MLFVQEAFRVIYETGGRVISKPISVELGNSQSVSLRQITINDVYFIESILIDNLRDYDFVVRVLDHQLLALQSSITSVGDLQDEVICQACREWLKAVSLDASLDVSSLTTMLHCREQIKRNPYEQKRELAKIMQN